MKVLVTGMAGFIGFSMSKRLLEEGHEVTGLDSMDHYYDMRLKFARLNRLGIRQENVRDKELVVSDTYDGCRFIKLDLTDRFGMERLFGDNGFDVVVNLAGQAGVRYSIENPYAYVSANVLGFLNVLEGCRHNHVKHLLYASSSSVYGEADKMPLDETTPTDRPVSLYAATKKSDELMAYSYSKLYGVTATALRFFTVYGPWGRPDMAPLKFMKAIVEGTPIKVFNNGELSRDFTYIDDIITAMTLIMKRQPKGGVPHTVYNIGHSSPVRLLDFIESIENVVGRKAVKEFIGMQPGDVHQTYADTSRLQRDFGVCPQVSLDEGISRLYSWFQQWNAS